MQEPAIAVAPPEDFQDSTPYRLVRTFYGDRRAERSQVPLINHINEGYIILQRIGASMYAAEAFCLHPLLQRDEDLQKNHLQVCRRGVDKHVIILAMEYRNISNSFLSDKVRSVEYTRGHFEVEATGTIKLSPLPDVNDMLIADKVQNRKDFLLYHAESHSRTKELNHYFNLWLEALGVTEQRYEELVAGL
jgi:hypothetical protein